MEQILEPAFVLPVPDGGSTLATGALQVRHSRPWPWNARMGLRMARVDNPTAAGPAPLALVSSDWE